MDLSKNLFKTLMIVFVAGLVFVTADEARAFFFGDRATEKTQKKVLASLIPAFVSTWGVERTLDKQLDIQKKNRKSKVLVTSLADTGALNKKIENTQKAPKILSSAALSGRTEDAVKAEYDQKYPGVKHYNTAMQHHDWQNDVKVKAQLKSWDDSARQNAKAAIKAASTVSKERGLKNAAVYTALQGQLALANSYQDVVKVLGDILMHQQRSYQTVQQLLLALIQYEYNNYALDTDKGEAGGSRKMKYDTVVQSYLVGLDTDNGGEL